MSVLQADRLERIAERPAEAHADHPRHDRHNLGRAPHVPRVRQRPNLRPCLHERGRREQPGNVSELASGGRLCRAPMSENSRPSANSPFSPPHQRQRSTGRPPASASLGQPRPIGRCVLAGRPHRPWFPHGCVPASPSTLTYVVMLCGVVSSVPLNLTTATTCPRRGSHV